MEEYSCIQNMNRNKKAPYGAFFYGNEISYRTKKNLTSEILLLHIHGIFGCILDALFYSSEEGLDRTNLCIEYIIPD